MLGSTGEKKLLPHTGVNGVGTTSKVLDLFGSSSSGSKDEAATPVHVPHRKRPQKLPLKTSRKSSNVPPVKGISIQGCSIPFYFCVCYI
jgi:hypothetical protein